MKTKRVITILFAIIAIIGIINFQSCSDDSVTAPPTVVVVPEPDMSSYVKIDSGYVPGAQAFMEFYSGDSVRTGYNRFFFVLHDSISGALITDAHITIVPRNHGHASPVENPDEDAGDGIFRGAMVYTQSFTDHWHIKFVVHNHSAAGEPEGEIEFSTPRVLDNSAGFKSIIMPDSTALYLSYISPENPVNGMNDFEFIINKNEPELFPPDGTYSIAMTPEYLPDGHTTGSNVNPTGTENGHYNGDVNFDMSGNWRIKLRISKNGFYYDTYFDLNY